MKFDTSGIDRRRLADLIAAEYGLPTIAATFLPIGEEAHSFVVEEAGGARHFARAQRLADANALERVYAATRALHGPGGLGQVLAPYPTRRGAFTCRYEEYAVAVFPFVDGPSVYDGDLADRHLIQAADLIAAVHRGGGALDGLPVGRERFENPFEEPIRHALQAANSLAMPANDYQRRVRDLLQAERDDLLAMLERMGQLREEALCLDFAEVVTHGDPNWANFLIDPRGRLHLTDWGEVAFGPPERDLWHFTGPRFEPFLRRYLAVRGPLRFHPRLFTFFAYRWAAQEIADYTTRLLFRNTCLEEDEHAWVELAPYLPIRHGEIEDGVREAETVIRRVGAGRP